MIAAPDFLSILVGRVPGLGAVEAAAFALADFPGEGSDAGAVLLSSAALFEFPLDHVEGLWCDDCLVVSLNVVLGDFTLVDFGLFCQVIDRIGLLE